MLNRAVIEGQDYEQNSSEGDQTFEHIGVEEAAVVPPQRLIFRAEELHYSLLAYNRNDPPSCIQTAEGTTWSRLKANPCPADVL